MLSVYPHIARERKWRHFSNQIICFRWWLDIHRKRPKQLAFHSCVDPFLTPDHSACSVSQFWALAWDARVLVPSLHSCRKLAFLMRENECMNITRTLARVSETFIFFFLLPSIQLPKSRAISLVYQKTMSIFIGSYLRRISRMPDTVPWSPRASLLALDWFMLKTILHPGASLLEPAKGHPEGPCENWWCLNSIFVDL